MKKLSFALGAGLLAATAFVGCSEDDPFVFPTTTNNDPTGTFTASSQIISQNVVMLDQVELSDTGWIVLYADDNTGKPVIPGGISAPMYVEPGTMDSVMVTITGAIADGDRVHVVLHTDDGARGVFEHDGLCEFDAPVRNDDDEIATGSFIITAPSITVSNQAIDSTRVATIDNVVAAVDGWLVIHDSDSTGAIIIPDIVGKTMVTAGTTTNVMVTLDSTVALDSGRILYPMLHLDNDTLGVYQFPGADGPEFFGNDSNNVITVSFELQ